ncbi:MAG TPA: M28 family peptidase [Segetibacter sp.]|nr:M28 family peptidase [Segetibacter sp.]
MRILLFVLAIFPTFLLAQSRKERKALEAQQRADLVVINNLKSHVQNLSNTEATRSGVEEYVSGQFKAIGLKPTSDNGFIQAYSVDDGKKIAPSTYLKVNNKPLELNKEYFPLEYSAEKKVTGMPAMALRERGLPWFVDLKELTDDNSKNQGVPLQQIIRKETARAAMKGATALLVYNSGKAADSVAFNGKDKLAATVAAIPVMYITQEGHKKYFNDHSDMLDIDLNVSFEQGKVKGSNIIGYSDNSATSTIVIGTHYNAFNGPGLKSENATKEASAVSADNKNGIAILIELARLLAASKAKSNNYLFIAFEGPEKSPVAENYWFENSTVKNNINYMISLDMPGGYNDNKKLVVKGAGSLPVWKNVLLSIPSDKKIDLTIDSSSVTADPYAVFSKKGIPQLLFTTSSLSSPSGVSEGDAPINYAGELQIAKIISRLVEVADGKGKLVLNRTLQQAFAYNNRQQTNKGKKLKTLDFIPGYASKIYPD